ncbi:MAG: hypothetical protein HWQ38_03855 [Nostoc sp. NMS7]|uniref:hypothetical protein n=1 Tax=Nostoc sp. NMS7 TaxID=2815391 RepID=UPI0025E52081|nr:hypothetical protein [Nostoc sp. NMS7]MBN3945660.1 hypothetical protein [Nostoc sp. NMS7]
MWIDKIIHIIEQALLNKPVYALYPFPFLKLGPEDVVSPTPWNYQPSLTRMLTLNAFKW